MKNKIIKIFKSLLGFPIIAIIILVVIILGIVVGVERASEILASKILMTVVFVSLMSVIIYVIYAGIKIQEPLDVTGLSKELEYFDIKKNIEKDIKLGRFSKEHYAFLYSSLSEHICKLDRLTQISFLNTHIYNFKRFSDESALSILLKLLSLFLSFFLGSNVKDAIEALRSGDCSLVRMAVYLIIITIITAALWYNHRRFVKPKHDFYLSILDQLKEDRNRDSTKDGNSKVLQSSGSVRRKTSHRLAKRQQ